MMCHSILFFNHFLCLLLLRELCCVYFCQQYLACFRYSSPNSFSSFCPLVTSWCRQYIIHRPSLACTSLSVLPDRRIGSVLFFYSTLLDYTVHCTTLLYITLLYSTLLHYHRQSRLFCILSFLSRYHELLHQINFIPSPTDCQTIPHTRHLRSHRPNHSYALAHLHLLSSAL